MPASYIFRARSSQLFRIVFCCLALTAVVGLSGCSRGKGRITTYRVKGKILLDGQPAEGANVAFYLPGVTPKKPPLPEAAAKMMQSGKSAVKEEPEAVIHPFPTAITDADGNFELSTYRAKDGSPAGNFVVVLSLRKSLNPNSSDPDYGPEEFPEAYTKPETSPLKIEIKGRTTLDTFELKSPAPKNS